jgi:hypothetical protein
MHGRQSHLLSPSAVTLVLAAALAAVQPLPAAPTARAQEAVEGENGLADRPLDNREAEAPPGQFAALDAESAGAGPTAPDDRDTSTARTAAAAPHVIRLPLKGGLDHLANGVGTRDARSGTARLRGAPPGATAVRASPYRGTLQAAAAPTQTVSFRGSAVTGALVGAAFFFNVININHPPGGALNPYSRLRQTRIGGDGQVGCGTASMPAVTDERTLIGAPPLTQTRGAGSPFNGNADRDGDDGLALHRLRDTHTDRFGPVLAPGVGNYVVRDAAGGDCILAVAHVLGTQ